MLRHITYLTLVLAVAITWDNTAIGWYFQFCLIIEATGLILKKINIDPQSENAIRHASIGAETAMIVMAIGATNGDSQEELIFGILLIVASFYRFQRSVTNDNSLPLTNTTRYRGINSSLVGIGDMAVLGSLLIIGKAVATIFSNGHNTPESDYLILLGLAVFVYGGSTLMIESCFKMEVYRRFIVTSRTAVIAGLGIIKYLVG